MAIKRICDQCGAENALQFDLPIAHHIKSCAEDDEKYDFKSVDFCGKCAHNYTGNLIRVIANAHDIDDVFDIIFKNTAVIFKGIEATKNEV